MALTRQEKLDAREAFAAGKGCEHCGALHQRACNRIKRQEWLGNGNRVVLEYFSKWTQPDAIWPDEAYDPDDAKAAGG